MSVADQVLEVSATSRGSAIALTTGGIAMMGGSLMPWLRTTTGDTQRTLSGLEAEGLVLLIAGMVCAVAGIAAVRGALSSWLRVVAAIMALGVLVDTLYVASDPLRASLLWPTPPPEVALGAGVWTVVAGSAVAFLSALVGPVVILTTNAWRATEDIRPSLAASMGQTIGAYRDRTILLSSVRFLGSVIAFFSLVGVFAGGTGMLMILAGHVLPMTIGLTVLGFVSFVYATWFFRSGPGRDPTERRRS